MERACLDHLGLIKPMTMIVLSILIISGCGSSQQDSTLQPSAPSETASQEGASDAGTTRSADPDAQVPPDLQPDLAPLFPDLDEMMQDSGVSDEPERTPRDPDLPPPPPEIIGP